MTTRTEAHMNLTRFARPSLTTGTRTALAAAAAALACMAAPEPAAAGTYEIWQCSPPGRAAHDKGDWRRTEQGGPAWIYGITDTCASSGARAMTVGVVDGHTLGEHQWVGMELRLPADQPDVRIVSGRLHGSARLGQNGAFHVWSTSRGDAPQLLVYCRMSNGWCPDSGVPDRYLFDGSDGFPAVTFTAPANADHVHIEDRCQNGYGGCPGTVALAISGIELTLAESVQPTVSLDGGTLLDGTARGTRSVTFTAGDAQSGVQRVQLLVDGVAVRALDLTEGCGFVHARACPASHSDTFTLATDELTDGEHAVAVRTTDAAGNSRTSPESSFTVDNVPDPSPVPVSSPATGSTGPSGESGRDGRDGAPGSPGAPGPATPNGENATAGARVTATFASSRSRSMKVPYGRRVVVSGTLLTPAGRPIAGARLDVHQRAKLPGATMAPLGHEVTTDARGAFRYVAGVGVSRTIRFGYKATLEDTAFSAQQDVELGVVAGVSLRTDRKALRNGQTLRFTGRVLGVSAGTRKVVELQVRKGRSWMTFRSTRMTSRGAFTDRYRFTRTFRTTRYDFRARVREETGFPFLTGASKPARVTVRR